MIAPKGGMGPTTFSWPLRMYPAFCSSSLPRVTRRNSVSSSPPYTHVSFVKGGHMPPPPLPPWQALQEYDSRNFPPAATASSCVSLYGFLSEPLGALATRSTGVILV